MTISILSPSAAQPGRDDTAAGPRSALAGRACERRGRGRRARATRWRTSPPPAREPAAEAERASVARLDRGLEAGRSGRPLCSPARRPCPGRITANSSPPQRKIVVGLSLRALEAFGDRLQATVAFDVPEPVVQLLESVEVEQGDAQRRAARSRAVDLDLERLVEGAAVAEAGERVDARQRLGAVALVAQRDPLAADVGHQHQHDQPEQGPEHELARGPLDAGCAPAVVGERQEGDDPGREDHHQGPARRVDAHGAANPEEQDLGIGTEPAAGEPGHQGGLGQSRVGDREKRVEAQVLSAACG